MFGTIFLSKFLYKAHCLDIHFQVIPFKNIQSNQSPFFLNPSPKFQFGSIAMAQLGELRRNFSLLKDINDNQETSLRYCETKLQNIVLGYLSWGRLFFFGVSFSFKCKDWWVVLALTLFSTFLYFLLFMDAVVMLSRTHDQLDIIRKELTDICQQILVAQNQDNVGLSMEAGEFSDGFELSFHEKMFMLDQFRVVETGRKVYIYFIVCALLALTAIELYACKCFLCN